MFYRPFLKETLLKFKETCEIVVWTAGSSEYANRVINSIDPDNSLFDLRLFREQCYATPKDIYVKDLRILNRDLSKTIIVDNSAYSFGFQPENGVLVLPFKGERDDSELLMLGEYLTYLMKLDDFRSFNKKHFMYEEFMKSSNIDSLRKKLLSSGD